MSRIHYAALDPYGRVLGIADNADEATDIALELAPGTQVQVQNIEPEPQPNAGIDAARMPELAMRQAEIGRIPKSALSMDLDDAHALLYPFFEGLIKRGETTQLYADRLEMADAWIGQNYKTEKGHAEHPPVQVMGLTLTPAKHALYAPKAEGSYAHLWEPSPKDDARGLVVERKRMLARWQEEAPKLTGKFSLCAGSSKDCRDSCLVFAGQNASERYNTYRKVAQTFALLQQPEAFMRMLVESIERWLRSRMIREGDRKDQLGPREPFFRLNVLSDVPWELVAPWLFDRFPDLQFYDYTKVPGRNTPPNYDLTFSVSGEDNNREWAHEEIHDRGRRIAVVFIGHKQVGDRWEPVKVKGPRALAEIPLPRTFWGLPVVDGDVSDVRPRDPLSCVGLRWKTPSGKRAGSTIDLQRSSFVTPVYIVSQESASQYATQVGRGGGLPRWRGGEEPNPSREQWLITAVTPRFQPIEPPMSQAG